jgi:valyl-tRNA synthetase
MWLCDSPPPTISGKLHMGHLFSYSQMDFLARYNKLKGEILYPFCYDNTGIPTEKLAFENGIEDKWDAVDFSEKVSLEYENLFRDMGMAFSYDKGRYSTFSNTAIQVADKSFDDLRAKGYLYEDERDSFWCPTALSWVSQSEIDDKGCYERTGTKVEIRKQHGWFINVIDHIPKLKEAINSIEWKPDFYKERLLNWIDSFKYDWSITRDRDFGVTVKAFGDEDDLRRYVYDTWFISSLTPQITWSSYTGTPSLKCPVFDARFQAHDIINTWALYTIIKSIYHNDQIPWKRIIISGHALTGEGGKMSKSKGKNIPPKELISKYGCDPIRYWAAHSQPGSDTQIDYEVMEKGKKLLNEIKNARKFINLKGKDGENFKFWDEWKTSKNLICSQFEEANWANALHELVKFFWNRFCDVFIEECKKESCGATLHCIYEDMEKYFMVFFPNLKAVYV